MKTKLCLFLGVFAIVSSGCDAQENGPKIELPNSIDYTYEIVADSIDIPWGLTFLNEKEFLVTDKAGVLYHVENGIKTEVDGLPQVYVRGQGGLLDIAVSPDYATTGTIYFTTSSPLGEDKEGILRCTVPNSKTTPLLTPNCFTKETTTLKDNIGALEFLLMMLGTSISPLGIEETVRLILKTSHGMEEKFIAST